MRRIKVILAVVALLVAMGFAASAMADSEMESSGGGSSI